MISGGIVYQRWENYSGNPGYRQGVGAIGQDQLPFLGRVHLPGIAGQAKGQCLAMRGIAYFHLIMNYQQT
mgnify:CR=1 FL=1